MYSEKNRSFIRGRSAIYIFTNKERCMCYIGSAFNTLKRLYQHIPSLNGQPNMSSNTYFQRSVNKPRMDRFLFAILEWVPPLPSEIVK